ncbi:MAG: efflux RND transporter permease subunit [Xanthomonadaceae bacterium]|nr:efflux RND transporter permease subunit [Xanthomonadaceae bacterium]
MSSPAEFSIRRPVTIIMAFVSLVAIGLISARLLPLEFFPELDVPLIVVQVPYPGSTPDEVEREITRPVEDVLATISDIKQMQSSSAADLASFQIEFDWGQDVAVKAVEARERVEAIRDQLPDDVRRIQVFKFNTADQPVLTLRISSERDLSNAYDMIMRTLIRPLERIEGVARVELQGLEPKEIRIELIADRVNAHQVDLQALQARLRAVNFSTSAGMLTDSGTRYRVMPRGEFDEVDQYRELVIGDGLRLGDIAEITYDSAQRNYARHLDRKYAIGVNILKENGANLVDVGRRTLAEVERIGAQPEMNGINVFFLENQADGVVSSLTDLRNAGLLGAVLSLLVLYFFLRNVPMTLMVALAVPVSLTITLGAMYFAGISLNILSMMGLMLAIGMLVDNAVVVSESIATERDKTPGPEHTVAATERGVRSVSLAVAAGTLTSAAVFLPNIFGEQNQVSIFLSHVAIAIVVSLAVSLVLAQTMIPMIASRLRPPARQARSVLLDEMRRRYQGALLWTLQHRWKSALLIVLTFASIAIPASIVETDMFPAEQDRSLFLRYNLDSHYPLAKVKRAVDRIEDYLYENQQHLQIRAVYSYYNESGEAQSSILLSEDSPDQRPSKQIADQILADMPEIAIGKPAFEQQRSGGEGVSVTVVGASSQRLVGIAEEIIRLLEPIEGLEGVRLPEMPNERELQIRVDRERARLLGFDSTRIAETVATALRGVNLRDFHGREAEVPVRLRFRETDSRSPEALAALVLTNDAGQQVPLAALVDLIENPGPTQIRRVDRETALTIRANLDDITMSAARERIERTLAPMQMPPGYEWRLGQGFTREDDTGQRMVLNILLALILIYMVLAALFESLLQPITMIVSILFSVVGVYWFFLVTGTIFSLMAMIGILILIGVVVNNGIVLIDRINQLRGQGLERNAAIVQAGGDRLRPILMTVGTTVLGLIPLCIGTTQIGGDGPPYFPMARAIVGGLLFSTVVSLLFLPTIYLWLDSMRHWPRRFGRFIAGFTARLIGKRKRRQPSQAV